MVDNMDAFLIICHSKGVEVDESQPALSGYLCVHAFDPFDNRLEIMEKL
jgi:hypothetical protein